MNLDDISTWLGKLYGLPGYMIVFLFCIAVIKALRSIKRFPNDGIWFAALCLGAILNGWIADPDTSPIAVKYRIWIALNSMIGGVVGVMAVIAYNKVLKKYITFFDGQREGDTDMIGRPPEEPPRSHHKK